MNKELIKRILSSILLTPIAFFFILKGSILFNLFIFLCLLISIYEWHSMSKTKSYNVLGHIFLIFSFYSAYIVRQKLDENGLFLFLFILMTCIFTDIGGYIFGKIFKGPKLTKISPKKTYSGVFGGYLLAITFSIILFNYAGLNVDKYINFEMNKIIFVLIISTISQVGDIIISYFKRLSKIKDTGKLIPGHGGILDRIDGIIFAFPFFYIFNIFGIL